jgi:DNA-directed RNA polymerase subunit E'/Rpb7
MANQDDRKIFGVYTNSVLNMKVSLSIREVGKNTKQNLERAISNKTEGKCISEGFIRPNSVRVISYSNGVVNNEFVEFQTVFECMVSHPVEGMLIECITKTITKAGIHAEVKDDTGVIPITVFVARDHHISNNMFMNVKETDKLVVRVIGVRFQLNDPFISVLAELVNEKSNANVYTNVDRQKKPKIELADSDED